MTLVQRLVREPNLILGVIVAGLSLLVLFGVDLTGEQMAGIGVFVGAVIALIRFVTTPASEVVAQQKPNEDVPTAGPAADEPDGVPVVIARAG
jgi:hypothetical protein